VAALSSFTGASGCFLRPASAFRLETWRTCAARPPQLVATAREDNAGAFAQRRTHFWYDDGMDHNYSTEMFCPVCVDANAIWTPSTGDFDDVDCPQCGRFRLSGSTKRAMGVSNESVGVTLSRQIACASSPQHRVEVNVGFLNGILTGGAVVL
jgi:hypothetical protein